MVSGKIFFFCLVVCVQCANKTFVATEKWKTIEDGEVLPAGLHVRMNLQTGKKEAKLLDKDENELQKSALIKIDDNLNVEDDSDQTSQSVKPKYNEDDPPKKKFRSLDEIRKEFGEKHPEIKRTMLNVVQKFESFLNNSESIDYEKITEYITDLTHEVHFIDSATHFIQSEGLQKIIFPCLNMTHHEGVRAAGFLLLGTIASNNANAQSVAVDLGFVQVLLRALALEKTPILRKRAGFALAAILRNFPAAHSKFFQDGGLSIFASIMDNPKDAGDQMKIRIIRVLSDFLTYGKPLEVDEHSAVVTWDTLLREQGWCARISNWFVNLENWSYRAKSFISDGIDHEMVLSSIQLLYVLSKSCTTDFIVNIDLVNAVNQARVLYADLALRDLDEGETESLYLNCVTVLKLISSVLVQSDEYRDEL